MSIAKSKIIIENKTIPQVALDFMNNTHAEEVDMVKTVGELIDQYQHAEPPDEALIQQISDSLASWVEHTDAHFARENELMQETGFPAYGIHAEAHEIAFNQLKDVAQHWQDNKSIDELADFVFSLWPNWFDNHVSTMDMMTAKFAVMNGFIEH